MKKPLNVVLVGTVLALFPAAFTGCRSIGPATVARDRFDYSDAITESWKRQTLLNIVKLRYLDPPIFVDVGQIVAGYSIETSVNAGGTLSSEAAVQGNYFTAGGAAKFTDRPTITYTPLTGNKFVKGLMTPIPPDALFFTIQSGWPADAMLMAALGSVNGLRNSESTAGGVSPPDEDFLKAVQLLRRIQLSGGVGLRVLQDTNKTQSSIITFRSKGITPETLNDITELRQLLHLDPDALELKLVFGNTPSDDRELAVITRSMLHIMQTMASQVDVPPEHVKQGRTNPGWKMDAPEAERTRLLRVHSSRARPEDVYVAVHYRGYWFWIDDFDLKSKRAFSFTMMLFTLAESGERESLPLITIPAQ